MKKSNPIQNQIIRFKRWSRKNYSIFCSLNRVISIGVLAKNIVEASCKKSNVYRFIDAIAVFPNNFDDEKNQTEFTLEELRLMYNNAALVLADTSSQEKNTLKSDNVAENGYDFVSIFGFCFYKITTT